MMDCDENWSLIEPNGWSSNVFVFLIAFKEWRRLPWQILEKSSHAIWHPGQQHERQLIYGISYKNIPNTANRAVNDLNELTWRFY